MEDRTTSLTPGREDWQPGRVPRLLLTPPEAAHALGISRSKLYELLRDGVVPSIRIGSCRRIALEDLATVVAQMRMAVTVAAQMAAAGEDQ